MNTVSSQTSFAERLEELWLHRWNQNFEETLRGLSVLQSEHGWEEIEWMQVARLHENEITNFMEALLLKASLLRAQGKHKNSSQLIGKIYRYLYDSNEGLSFHVAFEVGIDCWVTEDYQRALEFFMLAERKASTPVQQLFCYYNLLSALEKLDLEREEVELQLSEKLKSLLEHQPAKFVQHVCDQYEAYVLRKRFFQGNLRREELDQFLNKADRLTQAVFAAAFYKRLPFFSGQGQVQTGPEVELFQKQYLWQGSYRMRTLEGIQVPSDLELFSAGDAIDRLYLWTWMFLTDSPQMTLEKIELTLTALVPQLELEKLAVLDRLFLRNSLKWLGLLSPRTVAPFKALLRDSMELHPNYQVLENEFLFIDSLAQEKSHLPFDRFGYHWEMFARQIFDSLESQQVDSSVVLSRVAKLLIENQRIEKVEDRRIDWIVDMNSFSIRSVRSGETVRSKSLVELIKGLFESEKVDLATLGVEFQDDRRKAYNLVSRARIFFPEARIRIEGDMIICGAREEMKVYFAKQDLATVTERSVARVTARQAGAPEKVVSREAAQVQFRDGFSREEIEKGFRVSKAKACRVIAQWVAEGSVEKFGNGKLMSYRWKT